MKLLVNGHARDVDAEGDMPLLWALRDLLKMTGTKYACGIGECGACTVLIDGQPARSCQIQIAQIGTAKITTIEGLASAKDGLHPVQKAWIKHQVPQCGYCQSGQVLAAVALLNANANPSDDDIDAAMTNLCRCGTYGRIRAAIHSLARA